MSPVQELLHLVACTAEAHGIGQHQMIIRTAGYDADAALRQRVGQNRRIFHGLPLICLEFLAHSFLEADRLSGDYVHERAALSSGKNGAVYLLFQLVFA